VNKLPLLAKNAYLKLFYTQDGISSNLAYSHYDVGRSYCLRDYTQIKASDFDNNDFWNTFFIELEKEFDWNIIKEHGGIADIKQFEDEGNGISGMKLFYADEHLPGLETLKNFLPEVTTEPFGEDKHIELMKSFGRKFGYKDIMWVNLDLEKVSLHRLSVDVIDNEDSITTASLEGTKLSNDDLISILKESKLQAFLTESLNISVFRNAWADYIYSGKIWSNNLQIIDVLRAFVGIQILSLVSEDRNKFKDFGYKHLDPKSNLMNCAMIVTGNLVGVLKEKDLILTLIDGLQLSGLIDLYFDKTNTFQIFGESYFFGINSTDIILSRKDVIPEAIRLILPEVSTNKTGSRQVVMSGTMSDPQSGGLSIYALSPEIVSIKTEPKQKIYYNMKFVRGSYLRTVGETLEFIIDPEKMTFSKILIDCRPKPVIYGPDAKSNKNKISQWFA
jgi:hypothetical protein